MRVYAICSDGSPVKIAQLDSLETVTISPELEESLHDDVLRTLCPDIDFSINSEIDSEAMRSAFEIADALMAAARIMARGATISVEEALYAIDRLIAVFQGEKESLCELYKAIAEEDYMIELRAESMEPHPVIVVSPALEELRQRSLYELYGQGVDAGPLAVPSGADPPRR